MRHWEPCPMPLLRTVSRACAGPAGPALCPSSPEHPTLHSSSPAGPSGQLSGETAESGWSPEVRLCGLAPTPGFAPVLHSACSLQGWLLLVAGLSSTQTPSRPLLEASSQPLCSFFHGTSRHKVIFFFFFDLFVWLLDYYLSSPTDDTPWEPGPLPSSPPPTHTAHSESLLNE